MLVRTCVHVHLDTLQYTIEWTDFQSTVLARAMGVFHLNSIIHIQTKPDTRDHLHTVWQNLLTSFRVLFRSRQTHRQTDGTDGAES